MVEEEEIKLLTVKVNTLNTLAELLELPEEEGKERMEINRILGKEEKSKMEDLRQKSRVR